MNVNKHRSVPPNLARAGLVVADHASQMLLPTFVQHDRGSI